MSRDIVEIVRARASNPETIHDMAQGLSPVPKIYPPAAAEVIAAAEAKLGFALPPILKRVFTEIGNGGFGPGYGLYSLGTDLPDGLYPTALEELYAALREEPPEGISPWPEGLIPVCTWGCAIDSYVDCTQPAFPVSVYNPGTHCLEDQNLDITLTTADGEVIKLDSLDGLGLAGSEEASSAPAPKLIMHKATIEEWLTAWAGGVDLWAEMEALWSGDQGAWQAGGLVQ